MENHRQRSCPETHGMLREKWTLRLSMAKLSVWAYEKQCHRNSRNVQLEGASRAPHFALRVPRCALLDQFITFSLKSPKTWFSLNYVLDSAMSSPLLIFPGVLPNGGRCWTAPEVMDTIQNSDICPLHHHIFFLWWNHAFSSFLPLLGKQYWEKKSPTALVCRLENTSFQWKGIFPREEITVHLLLFLMS